MGRRPGGVFETRRWKELGFSLQPKNGGENPPPSSIAYFNSQHSHR